MSDIIKKYNFENDSIILNLNEDNFFKNISDNESVKKNENIQKILKSNVSFSLVIFILNLSNYFDKEFGNFLHKIRLEEMQESSFNTKVTILSKNNFDKKRKYWDVYYNRIDLNDVLFSEIDIDSLIYADIKNGKIDIFKKLLFKNKSAYSWDMRKIFNEIYVIDPFTVGDYNNVKCDSDIDQILTSGQVLVVSDKNSFYFKPSSINIKINLKLRKFPIEIGKMPFTFITHDTHGEYNLGTYMSYIHMPGIQVDPFDGPETSYSGDKYLKFIPPINKESNNQELKPLILDNFLNFSFDRNGITRIFQFNKIDYKKPVLLGNCYTKNGFNRNIFLNNILAVFSGLFDKYLLAEDFDIYQNNINNNIIKAAQDENKLNFERDMIVENYDIIDYVYKKIYQNYLRYSVRFYLLKVKLKYDKELPIVVRAKDGLDKEILMVPFKKSTLVPQYPTKYINIHDENYKYCYGIVHVGEVFDIASRLYKQYKCLKGNEGSKEYGWFTPRGLHFNYIKDGLYELVGYYSSLKSEDFDIPDVNDVFNSMCEDALIDFLLMTSCIINENDIDNYINMESLYRKDIYEDNKNLVSVKKYEDEYDVGCIISAINNVVVYGDVKIIYKLKLNDE